MRLILIDGNEANVDQAVGVSVYTNNLLHQFKRYASHDVRFCVYLRKEPKLHLPRENQYFRYRIVWGPFAWLKFFLPLRLMRDYGLQKLRHIFGLPTIWFHSYFAPAHYAPPWIPPKCRLTVAIHDLAYEFFPDEFRKSDQYKLHRWSLEAINHSSHVIAVSENTRQDILRVYNVPEGKVITIPNGFTSAHITTPKQNTLIQGHDYGLTQYKYLLYVGTLQPRKNISTLMYAFAMFLKEHSEYRLVIAGKKGWMYDEIFKLAHKLKIDQTVHFVGFVTEQEKAELYFKAFCFVLPSMYEGFGLPVLEAFSASCPVLCSKTSSLTEVGGDAALYFDPKQPNSLVDRLRELEKDLKLRHECIEKGLMQIQKFSWEKCGEATLQVLLK